MQNLARSFKFTSKSSISQPTKTSVYRTFTQLSTTQKYDRKFFTTTPHQVVESQKYFKSNRENIHSKFQFNTNILLLLGASVGFLLMNQNDAEEKNKEEKEEEKKVGHVIEGLKEYTLEEVAKHNTKSTGIWVTFRDGVYDITEFIEEHPGGVEKILLAAGKAIDPFWNLYAVHKTAEIFEILESYRIGNVALEDRGKTTANISKTGPYTQDPSRSPVLLVHTQTPFNGEPPAALLGDNYLTQNDLFYIRNHLPVPLIELKDEEDYLVEICFGKKEYSNLKDENNDADEIKILISLKDLKSKFKQHKLTATLQCTGNRREELSEVKEVLGLPWKSGAISNAEWTGIKLIDLLRYAGIDPNLSGDNLHIQFDGLDKDMTGMSYGASIPLNLALNSNSDILLAFQMNGEPLPRDHGYPLRVIVPGVTGARNVKWLHRIVIADHESNSHWQHKDYKIFPADVNASTANWEAVQAVYDTPVQSAILSPTPNSSIHYHPSDGDSISVPLKGYAWSGGGRSIERVEVSIDGEHWQQAELIKNEKQAYGKAWAWTLWEAEVSVPSSFSSATFICRAVDSSGNHQPQSLATAWNFRGLNNNAWNKVKVGIVKDD